MKAQATVIRGPASWAFIYIALGFALAIEGNIIEMASPPITFPWNVLFYIVVAAITGWQFLYNGRFHDWLFGLKQSYENQPH